MKNKGIAIQTILLLLIGVLVVGILVYMVYRYFTGSTLTQQECKQKIISWCNTCAFLRYTTAGLPMGSDVATCVQTYFNPAPAPGWSAADTCTTNRGTPYMNSSTICPQHLPR